MYQCNKLSSVELLIVKRYDASNVCYLYCVARGDHRGTDTTPPVPRHVQDYSEWSRDLLGGDEKCVQ